MAFIFGDRLSRTVSPSRRSRCLLAYVRTRLTGKGGLAFESCFRTSRQLQYMCGTMITIVGTNVCSLSSKIRARLNTKISVRHQRLFAASM